MRLSHSKHKLGPTKVFTRRSSAASFTECPQQMNLCDFALCTLTPRTTTRELPVRPELRVLCQRPHTFPLFVPLCGSSLDDGDDGSRKLHRCLSPTHHAGGLLPNEFNLFRVSTGEYSLDKSERGQEIKGFRRGRRKVNILSTDLRQD